MDSSLTLNDLPRRLRRRRFLKAFIEALEPRLLLTGNVTTFHADPLSTGNYASETLLNPGNVNASDFGRQFITALDGQVWAQPLTVENVNITRGSSLGVHNVLYVATMHDSLFAVDADTGAVLWQDSFLQLTDPRVSTTFSPVPTAGVSSFPEGVSISGITGSVIAGNDTSAVAPEIGIWGTPYIDATRGILYCVTSTQEWRTDTSSSSVPTANGTVSGTDWHYVFRMWAVNLSDGSIAVTPAAQTSGAPMPAAGGAVIADTVLNATASGHAPPYSSYNGYQYYAGPFIKGSGDNQTATSNTDGWAVNLNDTSSAFAGTTPTAQSDIALNAIVEGQRTAIAQLNGVLYLTFTSHGDKGPYYGWVVGINASTLQTQAAFVTTPTFTPWSLVTGNSGFHNGSTPYDAQGSIWGGQQGVITDGTNLYMSVGNGDFNWTPSNFSSGYYATEVGGQHVLLPLDGNYGNSYVKLTVDPNANQNALNLSSLPATYTPDGQNLNGYGLAVADYFTPSDLLIRNYYDWDVGSSGIVMFPNSVTSTVPGHVGDPMMAAGSKEGRIYLMDRNNMGGFNSNYFVVNGTQMQYANSTPVFNASNVPQVGPDPTQYDQVLGQYVYGGLNYATDGLGGRQNTLITPGFVMNGTTPTFFSTSDGGNLLSFDINAFQYGTSSTYVTNPTPLTVSSQTFKNDGSTPITSSNGTSNAIVWAIRTNNVTNNSSSGDDLVAYLANGTAPIFDSNTNYTANSLTGAGAISNLTSAKATKLSQPVIFNGMAYAGLGAGWGSSSTPRQGGIVGYGLLSAYLTGTASFFGAPTGLSGSYLSGTGITLSWTRNSTLETHTRIDRSPDGTTWTTIGFTDNGASTYTDATAQSGQTYFYRATAINGPNATAPSNSAQVIATPPNLASAVSRRTHGTEGTFDIALPLSGSPGIEDRTGGPTLLVLTFGAPVTRGTNFSVGLSSGTVGTTQTSASTLSIAVSGAADGQTLVVTVNDLLDTGTSAGGNYSLKVGVLQGDINATGAVNGADITLAKLATGQAVTAGNFRDDIDSSGVIDSADITLAKLASGNSLAPAPADAPSAATTPAPSASGPQPTTNPPSTSTGAAIETAGAMPSLQALSIVTPATAPISAPQEPAPLLIPGPKLAQGGSSTGVPGLKPPPHSSEKPVALAGNNTPPDPADQSLLKKTLRALLAWRNSIK